MARYTKQILTKALRELLREKKVNDITIHDLTDRAQVNRKTFYYHYHTLSDLLNEMCTESVRRIIGDEPIGPDNWQEKAEQLLYFVMEERHDMLAILSSVYARDYTAHIEELPHRGARREYRLRIHSQRHPHLRVRPRRQPPPARSAD